jgi:CRISPR/Cas system-associated exonuclease Cas4 (RecB family)
MGSPETALEERGLSLLLEDHAVKVINSLDEAYKPEGPNERYHNYASDLHHPCRRYLTYAWLNWQDRKSFTVETEYRLKEGREQEWRIKRELGNVGFEIFESGKSFKWPKYKIKGKIDGVWRVEGTNYPVEVKSISPYYWDSTRTVEDIKKHSKFWIRKITSQLNIYMLMMGIPGGFLALVTFGKRPRILPMLIDYELGEQDIQTAEAVNAHVAVRTYPDPIPFDPSVCGLCDFDHLCQPVKHTPFTSGVGPAEETDLKRYCDLRENEVAEYKDLEKKLIGKKEKPGIFYGHDLMVGDIVISTNRYFKKQAKIPQEVREKYIEEIEVVSTKIERLGE